VSKYQQFCQISNQVLPSRETESFRCTNPLGKQGTDGVVEIGQKTLLTEALNWSVYVHKQKRVMSGTCVWHHAPSLGKYLCQFIIQVRHRMLTL
jgi:hypothetical protein